MPGPEQLRILLIEDSDDDEVLVTVSFQRAGHDVYAQRVMTPEALQTALTTEVWHVVIADYSTPAIDAVAALAVVKQTGVDIPFIIVAGAIELEHAVTALRAGAHDIITKDKLERLAPAVQREMQEAALRLERRKAQVLLSESEHRFRQVWETTSDALVLSDKNGVVQAANPAFYSLYGGLSEQPLGFSLTQLFPEDAREQALEAYVRLFEGDEPPTAFETVLHASDGTERYVEARASFMVTAGRRSAMLTALRDVTDRKRDQAALVASERRFRALVENSADGLLLFDREGRITYRGPARHQLTGFTDVERLGQPLLDLVHPDDRDRVAQQMAYVVNQPRTPVALEYRLHHKDGTWRHFEAVFNNLLDEPTVDAVVSNFRDITERKAAEAALHQAVAQYRTLIEQIPAITYIAALDETNSTRYISPQIEQFGHTPAEHLADPGLWAQSLHPEDAERILINAAHSRISNGPVASEYRMTDRAGHYHWIRDQSVVVRDAQGQALFRQGVMFDISESKQAQFQIQRQFEQMAALRAIDLAIASSLDLRVTLDVFLAQVVGQLRVDATDILLLDPGTKLLSYVGGRGFRAGSVQQAPVRLGEGRAGRAALARQIITHSDTEQVHAPSLRTGRLGIEHFVSYYGVPLIAKDQVLGVLELFHRVELKPDAEWITFLEALAGQAAIAIENATLFTGLQNAHAGLVQAYDATIEGWSRALDLRDKETEGHSQRVTELTLRLGRAAGMGENELMHARRGALLHDMGKLGIPDRILLKPGTLTDDEWVIMRQHPTFARELLAPIAYLQPALEIPYCHHECWDGTGYPRGLAGTEIPLAARLFAVVDVWDALRSDRPYRPAWPEAQVLTHIRSLAGTHFDPYAVELFLQVVG